MRSFERGPSSYLATRAHGDFTTVVINVISFIVGSLVSLIIIVALLIMRHRLRHHRRHYSTRRRVCHRRRCRPRARHCGRYTIRRDRSDLTIGARV